MPNPHNELAAQPAPVVQLTQLATTTNRADQVPAPRFSVGRPHCQEPALPALQLCADCKAAGYCPWCGRRGASVGYCSTECLKADREPRRLEAEWVATAVKAYFKKPDGSILVGIVPDSPGDPDGPTWALTWAEGPAQWASTFTAAVNDLSQELPIDEWPGGVYIDDLTSTTLAIFFD